MTTKPAGCLNSSKKVLTLTLRNGYAIITTKEDDTNDDLNEVSKLTG
jgi:hypothetical protein